MHISRPLVPAAVALTAVVALAGCGSPASSDADAAPADAASSVTVEDNRGTLTLDSPPASVVALDNRTFETLSDWGIQLAAAPVALMPATNPYSEDASIADIGLHSEPNLELIVAAEPDVVVIGQRFTQYYDDIAALVPEATLMGDRENSQVERDGVGQTSPAQLRNGNLDIGGSPQVARLGFRVVDDAGLS